jgi:hypothetical protein
MIGIGSMMAIPEAIIAAAIMKNPLVSHVNNAFSKLTPW